MCVAVPAKVINIKGEMATVDFGGGTEKNINVSLVNVDIGHYVLVHAGFAIQAIDEEAEKETLKVMERIIK
jgi:hydrogenase expression/formation protein HypC